MAGSATDAAVVTTPAVNNTSFEDVLAYLVSYRVKDFYARLISTLPSREDKRVPMMGITVEKGHHVLLYNDPWLQAKMGEGAKGFNEVRATVAHEGMHFVLSHVIRGIKLAKGFTEPDTRKAFFKVSNAAADMAVNALLKGEVTETHQPAYTNIHEFPNEWVLPEQKGFPHDLTYEWYTSLLLGEEPEEVDGKKPPRIKLGKPGDGDIIIPGGRGAHELWEAVMDELSEEESELLISQLESDSYDKIKTSIEEQKRARGTVPGFAEETLDNLMKPPVVPWKALLHRFVTRCRLSKPVRSMERPRKRWLGLGTTLYPGQKRDKTFHLSFMIDTSGSMSSDDLKDGLDELAGIARVDKDIEITVVEFDTQIHKEYVLKASGYPDPELRGRGGTDFNKAFERAKELAKKGTIDALIIYTDGYAPAPELELRPQDIPTLWCLTEGGEHPSPGFGFEIRRPRSNRY
jgi:predicted metal-dependent peptidase